MSDPNKCPIETPQKRQEILLGVGESGRHYFYIQNGKKFLTEEQFLDCLDNNILVEPYFSIKIATEIAAKKQTQTKPEYTQQTQSFYSAPIEKQNLSLKIESIMYEPSKAPLNIPEQNKVTDINSILVGGTAILAMAMSALQNIKQKKDKLENQKCCSDSKLRLSNIEQDINTLKAQSKESDKAVHAEIYEQYKQLKELREDSEEVKTLVEKLINVTRK